MKKPTLSRTHLGQGSTLQLVKLALFSMIIVNRYIGVADIATIVIVFYQVSQEWGKYNN